MKIASRAFLFLLLLASPALAVESQRLTVSGESGAVNHVRILGTISTHVQGPGITWLTDTFAQNDIRLTNAEAEELSDNLADWAALDMPFGQQVQRSTPNAAYSVTVSAPYSGRYVRVYLQSGSYYLDNQFGTTESANVFSRQSMLLTKAEAQALADGLAAWVAGGPGGALFSKLVND